MIDPQNITNFNRDGEELEEFLLFGILVAGGKSSIAAKAVNDLVARLKITWNNEVYRQINDHRISLMRRLSDYVCVSVLGTDMLPSEFLAEKFKEMGIRWHNQKAKNVIRLMETMYPMGGLNVLALATKPLEVIEKLPGVGRKTARFFILHSRRDAECSVLDTHVLKYLRDSGVPNVPKSTPSSKSEYERLSKEFMLLKPDSVSLAEFDLQIWTKYASGYKATV